MEVSFLYKNLEKNEVGKIDLINAQKNICSKVSSAFYQCWFPTIFGVFYDFSIAQIFKVSFYYDFECNQVKCTVKKSLVEGETIDTKKELDEKIQGFYQNLKITEFLLIDPIEENHGRFFYAKESKGKVRVICKENVHPLLKELIESSLIKINERRN